MLFNWLCRFVQLILQMFLKLMPSKRGCQHTLPRTVRDPAPPKYEMFILSFLVKPGKRLPLISEKWSCERSRARVFIQSGVVRWCNSRPCCFLCKRTLKTVSVNALNLERSVFIKSLETNTNLHVKECAQVLTPWTKSALLVSAEESLSRGMGGASRGAPQQRALLHRLECRKQLTLQLGLDLEERNSSLFSVHCTLMPTCRTCFKKETLVITLITALRNWLHVVYNLSNCLLITALLF